MLFKNLTPHFVREEPATDQQQKNLDITAFFEVLLMLLPETLFYLYSFLLYIIYFLLATIATRRKE